MQRFLNFVLHPARVERLPFQEEIQERKKERAFGIEDNEREAAAAIPPPDIDIDEETPPGSPPPPPAPRPDVEIRQDEAKKEEAEGYKRNKKYENEEEDEEQADDYVMIPGRTSPTVLPVPAVFPLSPSPSVQSVSDNEAKEEDVEAENEADMQEGEDDEPEEYRPEAEHPRLQPHEDYGHQYERKTARMDKVESRKARQLEQIWHRRRLHQRRPQTLQELAGKPFKICKKLYTAMDSQGEYGLIDSGETSQGVHELVLHVTQRRKNKFEPIARQGDVIRARSLVKSNAACCGLEVLFTTPYKYFGPGRPVTMLRIGVPESQWAKFK